MGTPASPPQNGPIQPTVLGELLAESTTRKCIVIILFVLIISTFLETSYPDVGAGCQAGRALTISLEGGMRGDRLLPRDVLPGCRSGMPPPIQLADDRMSGQREGALLAQGDNLRLC